MINSPWKNKLIRDLAWCIGSFNLFTESPLFVSDSKCQKCLDDFLPQLHRLDHPWSEGHGAAALLSEGDSPHVKGRGFSPLNELENYVNTHFRPKRVGVYFEVLIAYWLSKNKNVSQLNRNIPVLENGITLGEFDFLFFDQTENRFFHWETAIKYYLYIPRESEQNDGALPADLNRYYGPQGKDQLHLKLKKTLEHQVKLSEAMAARKILENFGIDQLVTQVFWKGILFYPSQRDWKNFVGPVELSANHLRGWWTTYDEFLIPQSGPASQWMILSKSNWLSSIHVPISENLETFTLEVLKSKCHLKYEEKKAALLVAEVIEEDGFWKECSRGFILQKPFLL